MTIRAMIVDDEWAAIGNLTDLLQEIGRVEIVGEYTNPLAALEFIKEVQVDIVFLDIEMPGMQGMELANRILDLSSKTDIVFVTAYSEYAIEAFKLNAMDYLMKPVSLERLKMTLERVTVRKPPSTGKSKLNVKCFGKFSVEDGIGQAVKWRTNKTEELFAYLIDMNGQAVGKEKILDVIWREFDRERAASNFSTCLYYMRKTLREIGFPELLICSNGTYKLDMNQINSDIQQFESCRSQSHQIEPNNMSQFEEVIELCKEGYLELNYYEWVGAGSKLIEEGYTELIVQLSVHYRTNHMGNKAVGLLKKGLLRDPLHPLINRELMLSYLQSNNRIAALKHYNEYKRKLAKEFGIEPDHEMLELRTLLNLVE